MKINDISEALSLSNTLTNLRRARSKLEISTSFSISGESLHASDGFSTLLSGSPSTKVRLLDSILLDIEACEARLLELGVEQ